MSGLAKEALGYTKMEEKKILVIDDEENMRHMPAVLLEKEGYELSALSVPALGQRTWR